MAALALKWKWCVAAAVGLSVGLISFQAGAEGCNKPWPLFEQFASIHVQKDGRVIDFQSPGLISTSEGQSYSLFFALVAGDRNQFNRILDWSEKQLTSSGLDRGLPAWKWGRGPDGRFGVLDFNSASDADLWFAYTLLEAGRLWNHPPYTQKGLALLQWVRTQQTLNVKGLGDVILPGRFGFVQANGDVRLNPSYYPIFLMRRLATVTNDAFWKDQVKTAATIVRKSAPAGVSPDWVLYNGTDFLPDTESPPLGSYDAIRVYLWLGLMSADDPEFDGLHRALKPYLNLANRLEMPLEKVDMQTRMWTGEAPPGFYSALWPLAVKGQYTGLLGAIQKTLQENANRLGQRFSYYDWVLHLFAAGERGGRYQIDRQGMLLVTWNQKC